MNGPSLRVAAVQHDTVWADRDANFEHLAPLVRAAAGAGAGLVLLTEMFSTGFVTDDVDIGEPEGGPSSMFLAGQAPSTACGSAGRARRSPPGRRPTTSARTTASCSPGPTARSTATARSTRSRYGGEEKYFRAGTDLVTVDIDGLRVSSVRLLRPALRRRVLAARRRHRRVPRPGQLAGQAAPHWQRCCRPGRSRTRRTSSGSTASVRAVASTYTGDSRIVDPLGELLATGPGGETILLADVSRRRGSPYPRALPVPA